MWISSPFWCIRLCRRPVSPWPACAAGAGGRRWRQCASGASAGRRHLTVPGVSAAGRPAGTARQWAGRPVDRFGSGTPALRALFRSCPGPADCSRCMARPDGRLGLAETAGPEPVSVYPGRHLSPNPTTRLVCNSSGTDRPTSGHAQATEGDGAAHLLIA